jgi:hypothetical protein
VKVEFDCSSLTMTVSVPFVTRLTKAEIEAEAVDLKRLMEQWQTMQGQCMADPDTNLFYMVVLVEINKGDFVKRCNRAMPLSCCVAWLLPLDDPHYQENPNLFQDCLARRQDLDKFCEPFEAEEVYSTFNPIPKGELIEEYLVEVSGGKRSIDDIEDEAGFDVERHKFEKRQRHMSEDSEKMREFLETATLRLADQPRCSRMMRFMINELIAESRQPLRDYRGRAIWNFTLWYCNKHKLHSFFSEPPFNQTLPEDLMASIADESSATPPGTLVLQAFNAFFDSMIDGVMV